MQSTQRADDDSQYLLVAKIDNARNVSNILKAVHFKDTATVFASPMGLKVTVEDAKCVQANAFIQEALFHHYSLKSDQLAFKINLTVLLECLTIFGGSTSLKMCYAGYGCPLILMLEEDGVLTDCSIKTLEPDEVLDFDFCSTDVVNKIIMKSECLKEVFNELDSTSEVLQILMSPDQPYLQFSTFGNSGSTHSSFPKDSEMVESFQCTRTQTNRYKINLLKPSVKALALSTRISIRADNRGFLSLQYMITLEDGQICFVEYFKLLDRASYGFPHDTIVYDQDGTPMKMGLIDGRFVPPFGQKYFRRVRDIKVRDDDILLLGYPKTGCHWTWEVLNMIVAGEVGYSKIGKVTSMLEAISPEILESVPGRRTLNTHLWYDYIPKQAIEKKTKMVFTVRNPKDTAVSYYNHHLARSEIHSYNGPFNKWFLLFMSGQVYYGSYFDFHVSWDKVIKENPDQQILIVSYEDMKEDLPREIRRMAKFLDINLSDGQVEEIAKAAGFDAMKEAYADTKISKHLIRKGQVGDWKNWLTVAQSEMIDEATEEKLKGTLFSSPRYTI